MPDDLVIAGRAFKSRLIVGTGKYRSFQEMARAHAASGADMVTVAVRRVNLTDKSKESLLDYIDREKIFILPNTAACYTADEAIRTARLAREVGLSNWVKLEVIGDQQTPFPDTEQLIEATCVLVKEGFVVLPYTNDDLIAARKLIEAGAAAVMPLAAPIGSGLGVQNPANLRILRERITEVPMIVDAGVGTASDAAVAMELGADGVLMNTAIAEAQDAILMAEAMRDAVIAGRKAYLAGRMPKRLYASASSPMSGVVRCGFFARNLLRLGCFSGLRVVVALAVNRRDFCAHASQVRRELAAMVNRVMQPHHHESHRGPLHHSAKIHNLDQPIARNFRQRFVIFREPLLVPGRNFSGCLDVFRNHRRARIEHAVDHAFDKAVIRGRDVACQFDRASCSGLRAVLTLVRGNRFENFLRCAALILQRSQVHVLKQEHCLICCHCFRHLLLLNVFRVLCGREAGIGPTPASLPGWMRESVLRCMGNAGQVRPFERGNAR